MHPCEEKKDGCREFLTLPRTVIHVEKALEVVEELLNSDDSWKERTYLDSDQVLRLLGFCLRTTYFTFWGDIYKQDGGCTMGSAVSPIIANLYMEYFEQLDVTSAFIYLFYYFIKTSFAWVTMLSVNTVFQFGPGVKHNTSK